MILKLNYHNFSLTSESSAQTIIQSCNIMLIIFITDIKKKKTYTSPNYLVYERGVSHETCNKDM